MESSSCEQYVEMVHYELDLYLLKNPGKLQLWIIDNVIHPDGTASVAWRHGSSDVIATAAVTVAS